MQKFNFYHVAQLSAILILIMCGCEESPSGPETPVLSLSPNDLSFSYWETEKSFQINNKGSGTLEWNVAKSPDQNWMSASPDNGTNSGSVSILINGNQVAAGSYTGNILVESNAGSREISVRADIPYFADDFSAGLAKQKTSYCNAWIENEILHYAGTSNRYYGRVISHLSSYIPAGYAFQARMARVSSSTDDRYCLYIRLSDSGSPCITSLRLMIPESSEENWYLLAFISGISSPKWALLDANSYGYSDLINGGTKEWNDFRLTVGQDKSVKVHVGNEILHSTKEIKVIEDLFNITVDMECVGAELWTAPHYEVMADDVAITSLLTGSGLGKTVAFVERNGHLTEQTLSMELKTMPNLKALSTVRKVFNLEVQ